MRLLLLLCVVGGCDPAWHVRNVATASSATRVDAGCIEAGLQATGLEVKMSGAVAEPGKGWYRARQGLVRLAER